MIRHDQVEARYAHAFGGDDPHGTTGSQPASTDAALMERELTEALQNAVHALPPRVRQAYVLRVEHELSYAEIAETMGVTVKAIERLMTRANATLHKALQAYR